MTTLSTHVDATLECGEFHPILGGLPAHRSGGFRTTEEKAIFAAAKQRMADILEEDGWSEIPNGNWEQGDRLATTGQQSGATETIFGVGVYVLVRDKRGVGHLLNRPLKDWRIDTATGEPELIASTSGGPSRYAGI